MCKEGSSIWIVRLIGIEYKVHRDDPNCPPLDNKVEINFFEKNANQVLSLLVLSGKKFYLLGQHDKTYLLFGNVFHKVYFKKGVKFPTPP